MECVPFSAFPAQAGAQTLAHRREVGHCPRPYREAIDGVVDTSPSPHPPPPRGRGLCPFFLSPLPEGEGPSEGLVSFLPCSPRRRGPRTLHAGWNQRSGPPPSRGTRLIGERVFLMLSLSKHEEAALNDTTARVPTMFLLFKPLGVLDRSA